MKNKLLRFIICAVLVAFTAISAVPCYALNINSSEVDRLIEETVSKKASSLGVSGVQGIVNYYADSAMTLGGEWYVLSFLQNGNRPNFSKYEKNLISYLKNNTVYSAPSREKFALVLIALNSKDSFAKRYIQDVSDEAIGKKGIMSYVYGLHLLNNGCASSLYTKNELVRTILSLQNSDGGWALSGSYSDVDVTAMTLEALAPYRFNNKSAIDKAVKLLSERQSERGDFQSYGTYNAESTAQVIIALSALGINPDSDSRFIKNGNSCLDGLLKYKTSGGFAHAEGGSANNSASSQALDAFVAFSRFLKGKGSYYILDHSFVPETTAKQTTTTKQSDSTFTSKPNTEALSQNTSTVSETVSTNETPTNTSSASGETESSTVQSEKSSNSDFSETEQTQAITEKDVNNDIGKVITVKKNVPKYKLIASAAILLLACLVSGLFIILKRRNYKNFIVIFAVAAILIAVVFFTNIVPADSYYNGGELTVENPIGTVTVTVRCDTVAGMENAPTDPVIIEKTILQIEQGETAYSVLARASRYAKVPFEHNANYYVSGIDNLYELQFGELSGWMYRVNGVLPSVGCNEYALSDGDTVEWLYTCDIGNDLSD